MPARKSKAHLRVIVNPFVALDHEGRPAAAVAFDSGDKLIGMSRRHIGAKHDTEVIEAREPASIGRGPDGRPTIAGDGRKSLHDIRFRFSADVQTIPDTAAHRRALDPARGGQPPMLPADEETAARVGRPFVDPSTVIVETAKVKVAEHFRNTGELPDWAHFFPALVPSGATAKGETKADLRAAIKPDNKAEAKPRFLAGQPLHVSHDAHADFLSAHLAKLPKPAETTTVVTKGNV